jgi:hypothetical protein
MTLPNEEPSSENAPKLLDITNYRDGDMLQRLFHACQGKETLAKVNLDMSSGKNGTSSTFCLIITEFHVLKLCFFWPVFADAVSSDQLGIFQHSQNLLRYWALWETARYCVLSRLRTPFGGPQQTLDALEKHLNSLLRTDHKKMDAEER